MALLTCLLFTGCMETDVIINAKQNGSGTIDIQSTVNGNKGDPFLDFLAQASAKRPYRDILSDKNTWHKAASRMGKGIVLSSFEVLNAHSEQPTVICSYSVENLNTLKLGPSIAGVILREYGLNPLTWNYNMAFRKETPAKLMIFPPPMRRNPDAVSMNELMRGMTQLPGMQQLFESLASRFKLNMSIQTESPIQELSSSHPPEELSNQLPLIQLDLSETVKAGKLSELMRIKDMHDIMELYEKQLPGIFMQDPSQKIILSY